MSDRVLARGGIPVAKEHEEWLRSFGGLRPSSGEWLKRIGYKYIDRWDGERHLTTIKKDGMVVAEDLDYLKTWEFVIERVKA